MQICCFCESGNKIYVAFWIISINFFVLTTSRFPRYHVAPFEGWGHSIVSFFKKKNTPAQLYLSIFGPCKIIWGLFIV